MKRQSQKNSVIQGFLVLKQLGGTESAKEYILQGKKKVTFSDKNPLHLFILSLIARDRQVINAVTYKKDLLEEYGISITAKDLDKFLFIPVKVLKRKRYLVNKDILQGTVRSRIEYRKKLFYSKMKNSVLNWLEKENKRMIKEKERRIGHARIKLEFETSLGTNEVLVGFINNGKVEIRRE